MATFSATGTGFTVHDGKETLEVQTWGGNGARVRSTMRSSITETPGSALEQAPNTPPDIELAEGRAVMRNGELVVEVTQSEGSGFLRFPPSVRFLRPNGTELLSEQVPHFSAPPQRRYRPAGGDLHNCEVSFRAFPGERFYGLGQHQHGLLDQKGAVIELVQRNTEVSVPFVLSNRGYGFLWNMPGTGRAELASNSTKWVADAARQIDYWVTAAGTPSEIVSQYSRATGLPPMLPEWAAGFWQCKLRYRTQDELLEVVREHKRRGLPLSVVVIDYFHWSRQGEWKFDAAEWPDPQAMVDELKSLGVELMVSIWPSVNPASENHLEMDRRGLLIGKVRSLPLNMPFWDKGSKNQVFVRFYDATNPEARSYVWDKVTEGYGRFGIRAFWLDACEPEMLPEDPEDDIFYLGTGLEVHNVYPREHARGFAEGLWASGEKEVLTLCRSAWAGSQRYGAAVWSGDVDSTFEALAQQIPAGLNIGISGIPWWTTDIGGFKGGDPASPYFRELIVRWFQFGVFCPLFRLHGVREPAPLAGSHQTGGPNEVWSFGEEAYTIICDQLALRERLRPYVMHTMSIASATGVPAMRAMFMEFPDEPEAWELKDQYMFGPDVLVAPVITHGA
ncbi:MAG TPA: TIM-barrel domain-containing protein, partial [Acidimicrobiales bacterium]|nr:TIM-barrel domain-containing protein [Acidimicrobiales bacterium]